MTVTWRIATTWITNTSFPCGNHLTINSCFGRSSAYPNSFVEIENVGHVTNKANIPGDNTECWQ